MIIQPKLSPKILEDYDVLLISGIPLSFTIDRDAGDAVDFDTTPLAVIFKMKGRPAIADPDKTLPDEETTVYVKHIASITKRTREVYPMTPDQQVELKTLHKLSPTIQ